MLLYTRNHQNIAKHLSSNEKIKSRIQWLFCNETAHTQKESGTAKLFLLELHSASQPQILIELNCECEPLC